MKTGLSTIAFALAALSAPIQARTVHCPSQNFDVFIRAFANSQRIQTQFTRFPLPVSGIVTDNDEYDPQPRILQQADAKFPLLPLQPERKRSNMKVAEIVRGKTSATVRLAIPDSDAYDVDFQFSRQDGCWFLTKIDNASL